MITQAEEKPCVDAEVVNGLHETYEKLKKEPKKTLEHSLQYYIEKQYEFEEKLRKDCSKDNNQESENSEFAGEVSLEG